MTPTLQPEELVFSCGGTEPEVNDYMLAILGLFPLFRAKITKTGCVWEVTIEQFMDVNQGRFRWTRPSSQYMPGDVQATLTHFGAKFKARRMLDTANRNFFASIAL